MLFCWFFGACSKKQSEMIDGNRTLLPDPDQGTQVPIIEDYTSLVMMVLLCVEGTALVCHGIVHPFFIHIRLPKISLGLIT